MGAHLCRSGRDWEGRGNGLSRITIAELDSTGKGKGNEITVPLAMCDELFLRILAEQILKEVQWYSTAEVCRGAWTCPAGERCNKCCSTDPNCSLQ
jgi:hypothetical protein